MVTRRCTMKCTHCSVESAPGLGKGPSESELLGNIREMATAGVRSILITGGEPMTRSKVVLAMLEQAHRLGIRCAMTSNGFWGKTPEAAHRQLRELLAAGLNRLTLSYDRYHAEFQGSSPILHIARAAALENFPIYISVTRLRSDEEVGALIEPYRELPNVRFRFYDVQAVGAARNLEVTQMRHNLDGFCNACTTPALTDDGRLTACNGPAYFSPDTSPLSLGRPAQDGFAALAQKHRDDVILEAIRTLGPAALRNELTQIPEFANFAWKESYGGMCDLCTHLTSDPHAVAALRKRLSDPQKTAERLALRIVTEHARRRGTLNYGYVNGLGSRRAIFQFMRGKTQAEPILERQDLDWSKLLAYLTSCGLAGPLRDGEQGWRQCAPSFFAQEIEAAATRASYRRLIMKDALRKISAALVDLNLTGIILKGALAIAKGQDAVRDCGDIDLWLPNGAQDLHRKLKESGWQECPGEASHHLAPLVYRDIPLEIHTQLMPPFWGLPEAAMAQDSRPLPLAQFRELSPEGQLLHYLVHCSKHGYSHGLKCAYDVARLLEVDPDLDWVKLARWVKETPMPLAFSTSLQIFRQELGLGVPNSFLALFARSARLERVAQIGLFTFADTIYEVNPLLRTGLYWLLQSTWPGRIRCLFRIIGGDSTRLPARAAADRWKQTSWKTLWKQVKEARAAWKMLR